VYMRVCLHICVHAPVRACTCTPKSHMTYEISYHICDMRHVLYHTSYLNMRSHITYHTTGWRRLIGSPKLQIIFHKRATKYRSLLRNMTYKDKGSYDSSPPCTVICVIRVMRSHTTHDTHHITHITLLHLKGPVVTICIHGGIALHKIYIKLSDFVITTVLLLLLLYYYTTYGTLLHFKGPALVISIRRGASCIVARVT